MQHRQPPRRAARCMWAVLLVLAMPAGAQVPGACRTPAAEREGEVGCYHLASQALGLLPEAPLYWHLYAFDDPAQARAVADARSTALEAHGRNWLLAIAPQDWRLPGRAPTAVVGPLPVATGRQYTARYMEAITPPGMRTRTHLHSGPEAFYMLEGSQCVLTPGQAAVLRAGQGGVTPGDTAMTLEGVGTAMRRSLVLVLHESDRPWMTMVDWTPDAVCPGGDR